MAWERGRPSVGVGLAGDCAFKRGKIPQRKRRCCVSCRKSGFGGLWEKWERACSEVGRTGKIRE